jgi:hypothetical protein
MISVGKKVTYGLSALLFATVTNIKCAVDKTDVTDLRRIPLYEFIKDYRSVATVKKNISQEKNIAFLNSLAYINLSPEKYDELINLVAKNKNEAIALFKKHNIDIDKFLQKSVMAIVKENPEFLSHNELEFLKEFKNKLSLNPEQLKRLGKLRGEIFTKTLPFKNGHYIVGALWTLAFISLAVGIGLEFKKDNKDRSPFSIAIILALIASCQPCIKFCGTDLHKPDDLIHESTSEFKMQQELKKKYEKAQPELDIPTMVLPATM